MCQITMDQEYAQNSREAYRAKLLRMSSLVEDAPYIVTEKSSEGIREQMGNTCQCSSCRSAGGTCRASTLESKTPSI